MDVLAGPRPEGTRRRALGRATDTIAHISHRPMAITRLSNASMNHANQIISCARGCSSCPPPPPTARPAHSSPPSDSTPSPRCLGEKYSTVLDDATVGSGEGAATAATKCAIVPAGHESRYLDVASEHTLYAGS